MRDGQVPRFLLDFGIFLKVLVFLSFGVASTIPRIRDQLVYVSLFSLFISSVLIFASSLTCLSNR